MSGCTVSERIGERRSGGRQVQLNVMTSPHVSLRLEMEIVLAHSGNGGVMMKRLHRGRILIRSLRRGRDHDVHTIGSGCPEEKAQGA